MSYIFNYQNQDAYPYQNTNFLYSGLYRDDPSDCTACNAKMELEGVGTINVSPDTAVVFLGVINEGKEINTLLKENAEKVQTVIDTLTKAGIAERDIKTENYSIDPQYDFIEGKQSFRGYRITNNLRVTVRDVSKVGRIIDAAVASGANVFYNVNFALSEPSAVYNRALSLAISNVVNKAKSTEKTLSIIVSSIPTQIIEEIGEAGVMKERFALQSPPSATPIRGGEIEITAKIKATFLYRKF